MEIKAIDLGLSVKWADRNLGAESPKTKGTLMSWGVPKEDESNIYQIENPRKPFIDVAEKELGEAWRMPTRKEFEELVDKCTWEWCKDKNVYNVIGPNGNSIILPATGYKSATAAVNNDEYDCDNGYYWSSNSQDRIPVNLSFTNKEIVVEKSKYVWHTRQAIRPVSPKEDL